MSDLLIFLFLCKMLLMLSCYSYTVITSKGIQPVCTCLAQIAIQQATGRFRGKTTCNATCFFCSATNVSGKVFVINYRSAATFY